MANNVDADSTVDDSRQRYATDPTDNDFIELLIRVVEHCAAFQGLQHEEQRTRNELSDAQFELDATDYKLDEYTDLEEPALDPLIEITQESVEYRQIVLGECKTNHEQATKLLKSSTAQRKRLLLRLYRSASAFVNRVMTKEVHCAPLQFGKALREDLMMLVRHSDALQSSQSQLTAGTGLRRKLLDAHQRTTANPDQPAERGNRKKLLAEYTEHKVRLERQKERHMRLEQQFFVGVIHPTFVEVGILPSLESPPASPTQSELTEIDPEPREQGWASHVTRFCRPMLRVPGLAWGSEWFCEAFHRRLPGDHALPSVSLPYEPQRERLREARKQAAEAKAALKSIEDSYVEHLAVFLMTYRELDKDRFDGYYPTTRDGKNYEARRAEAAVAVRQAEADCDTAWNDAVAAGMTDLPPSPKDLGDRSEDGYADSCNSEGNRSLKRIQKKQRPTIERWSRRVARGGSPPDPEKTSPRASAEVANLAPAEARERTPDFGAVTSKNRVKRYERHQERTMKRAAEQDAELPGATDRPRVKRRCIIL